MVIDKAGASFIIAQGQKATGALNKIFEKLSTGKSINRASDDAAMLSVARELEKQVRGFKAVSSGLEDAMSALRISDGGSSQITEMVQRQRELAIQSSNGTLTDANRQALDKEYQALSSEIDRISASTQFNNQKLLDGSSPLSDGSGTTMAGTEPNAAGNSVAMPAVDVRASSLGVTGTSIATASSASSAVASLDTAMSRINQSRTQVGASYNRLDHANSNANSQETYMTDALSRAEDLDFAVGVTDKARNSLLQQSSYRALSNFQQISRNNVLGLLQS